MHNSEPRYKFQLQITKQALIAFILILFSGFSAPGQTGEKNVSPPEESVIFGRLVLDWRSDDQIDSADRLDPMVLTVLHEASGKRYEIVCEPNGSNARFFARLPAGSYRIIQWSKGESDFRLPAAFEVAKGEAAYIGSIQWRRIVSPLRPPPAKSGTQRGTLLIGDEFETEALHFKERHPEMKEPVVKSIIKMVP